MPVQCSVPNACCYKSKTTSDNAAPLQFLEDEYDDDKEQEQDSHDYKTDNVDIEEGILGVEPKVGYLKLKNIFADIFFQTEMLNLIKVGLKEILKGKYYVKVDPVKPRP